MQAQDPRSFSRRLGGWRCGRVRRAAPGSLVNLASISVFVWAVLVVDQAKVDLDVAKPLVQFELLAELMAEPQQQLRGPQPISRTLRVGQLAADRQDRVGSVRRQLPSGL